MQRCLIMGDCDHGLDPILAAFIKHIIIKLQSLFIGLLIIPIGEDPGPGNGQTEYLKAHFCKHGNILFVPMIKIDCHKFHVIHGGFPGWLPFDSSWHNILDRQAFSICPVRAFTLVGSHCSSPHKMFRKLNSTHHFTPFLLELIEVIRLALF